MRSIKLKNVKTDEIGVLWGQISCFINDKSLEFKSTKKDNTAFYISFILIDVLVRLTYKLRNKMERNSKKSFSISFTISEASALILLCFQELPQLTDYQRNVLLKTRNSIDEQLTNLI